MRLEPRVLLVVADEMVALAGEREAESGLSILTAHAALESFCQRHRCPGDRELQAQGPVPPEWHDLCEWVLGRQLDSAPDRERLQAIRDALVGYEGEAERLDRRTVSPRMIAEYMDAETALWAVDTARHMIAECHRLAGRPVPDWVG
jgi:hypothetical protein